MAKRNKFRNRKVTYKGIKFDSIKELKRYKVLELLVMAKEIESLEVQPVFLLQDKFKHDGIHYRKVCYVSDFRYIKDGITIVEDVKSDITAKEPLYVVKKKLFVLKYVVPSNGKLKFFELN